MIIFIHRVIIKKLNLVLKMMMYTNGAIHNQIGLILLRFNSKRLKRNKTE